ncbi:hypothetical protein mRhiFer1_008025 [Rhinolophus ferrumequinum]|uniref:Uncharacterized protein n=1 Tax=Rhinolophus ferrumequinum TaxID=59479 RepID=A0A7J7WQQ7_RHIFE|nr:hypothetical protein mRhiFer1_008025 [Rhinolophus ferrumequinum]
MRYLELLQPIYDHEGSQPEKEASHWKKTEPGELQHEEPEPRHAELSACDCSLQRWISLPLETLESRLSVTCSQNILTQSKVGESTSKSQS